MSQPTPMAADVGVLRGINLTASCQAWNKQVPHAVVVPSSDHKMIRVLQSRVITSGQRRRISLLDQGLESCADGSSRICNAHGNMLRKANLDSVMFNDPNDSIRHRAGFDWREDGLMEPCRRSVQKLERDAECSPVRPFVR